MFNSILSGSLNITSASIIFITSIVLGIIIAFINMKTTICSKNMSITLSILPFLVSVVIIMVNGNLGTGIAALGTFSLVRFRSIPGNSKEISIIFFAMSVGIALGTGYIGYAIMITLIGSIVIYLLTKFKFYYKDSQRVLRMTVPEGVDYTNEFNDVLKKYTNSYTLSKIKTTQLGSLFELTYLIDLKGNEKAFIDDLRVRNGNLKVMLERDINNETEL